MRACIVSCVFPPEPVISAQTSFQIAESLQKRGDEVIVIAPFPNRPAGKIYAGYKRKLFFNQELEGIKVVRCFNTISKESTISSRLAENISFGISSGFAFLFSKRPDVIFLNTWPIFATGMVWVIARMRRIPIVISVQDVYPESLIIQNRIGANNWWVKILRKFDEIISRGSKALIVISKNFAAIYLENRMIEREKVYVIPNWIDTTKINQLDRDNNIKIKYNIPRDGFLFVYGGNIGMAAGVEKVIEAFSHLPNNTNIYLLIAGEGSNLAACKEIVARQNLPHVIFHTPWLVEETAAVLAGSNVLVLPTLGDQSLVSMPSKAITYMLSGRPILAQVHPASDCAQLIREAGCGWVVNPDAGNLLAEMMKKVGNMDDEELSRMGENGRKYALENLSKEACLPKVLTILDNSITK